MRRKDGKSPKIREDRMTENRPKSQKIQRRKIARNRKTRNDGKSLEILEDAMTENHPNPKKL